MSRRVYFIRHARPDIPFGERWCVGSRTDFPLGAYGRIQASLLPYVPELQNVSTVFCSWLSRAKDTALAISHAPVIAEGLEEQDMGAWDGLSFTQIKEGWPELYAARELDPYLLPDGAETYTHMADRFGNAVKNCIAKTSGDIAIVAHKSSISTVTGSREMLGWTSISTAEFDGEDFKITEIGRLPHPTLTDEVCLKMMLAAGADADLRMHCKAVPETACMLCDSLGKNELHFDRELIRSASLLHDIARSQKKHAAAGATWLKELGYPEISDIIRQHHDPDGTELNEAAVVFIADKAVKGCQRVDIEERFAASLAKCKTPEAIDAHGKRLEAARKIKKDINNLCGAVIL